MAEKIKKKNEYKATIKKKAPYLAFGVGAGAGALTALKTKGKVGKVASAILPIIGGTSAYTLTRKVLGKHNTLNEFSIIKHSFQL